MKVKRANFFQSYRGGYLESEISLDATTRAASVSPVPAHRALVDVSDPPAGWVSSVFEFPDRGNGLVGSAVLRLHHSTHHAKPDHPEWIGHSCPEGLR